MYIFKGAMSKHVISPNFGGLIFFFRKNLPIKIAEFSYTSPYLEFQVILPNFIFLLSFSYLKKKIFHLLFEPFREKTCLCVSNQVRHKRGCTVTEDV